MAKIVINKNFQKRYLFKAYERLIKSDYNTFTNICASGYWITWGSGGFGVSVGQNHKTVYKDLSSSFDTIWKGMDNTGKESNSLFVCDETFLLLLDKINTSLKNTSILQKTPSNIGEGTFEKNTLINELFLVNSLFNNDVIIRNNTIKYFRLSGLITEEEEIIIKNILTPLVLNNNINFYDRLITVDNIISNFNDNLSINITTPLKLNESYISSIDNINGNQLYLLCIPYSDTKFINGNTSNIICNRLYINTIDEPMNWNPGFGWETPDGKYLEGCNILFDKTQNKNVYQIPYLAFSLSEENGGGDIEYDHLDEIEYLDNIKLSIELPKQYS